MATTPITPAPTTEPEPAPASRQVCSTCRRPRVVCYCEHLLQLPTRTQVVFLQHPREARVPIGTARMAHLMLPSSELHRGVQFQTHPRVQELAADPSAALLFPGEGALDPTALEAGSVRTLVVVDGTWAQARKVLKQNPILTRLRRIGLVPAQPGNYRIRREPTPDSLATIEAVSAVLGVLEQAPERFSAMLSAFTFMVDRQIALAAERTGPPRHRRARGARVAAKEAVVRERLARAVAVHAEGNGYPLGDQRPERPELLHLVARRLRTGESFQAFVAPRRPLAPNAAFHIELQPAQLLGGESITSAMQRWTDFVRPGDVLCGWGSFARDALLSEGAEVSDWCDLRLLVSLRLQRSPGALRQAAQDLGAEPVPSSDGGRAQRTVTEMERLIAVLARPAP
ncbi:MAG: tRNA-uridine aminocarboxypropyltransferase [Polyangia bacterium]